MLLSSMVPSCDKGSSMLDGTKSNPSVGVAERGGGGGGGASAQELQAMQSTLSSIDSRLKALETVHTPGAHQGGGPGDATLVERVHQLEAALARREEALGFLDMAYAQQKRQMEAQEAQQPDDNAVFAVDITGPLKAGQVEGPNSAIVTVVEAWDFA
jgi:hypothetical protein